MAGLSRGVFYGVKAFKGRLSTNPQHFCYPPFKTTLWSLRSGEFTIQITYEKGRLLEKSLRHF
jgi:hypothetical protein